MTSNPFETSGKPPQKKRGPVPVLLIFVAGGIGFAVMLVLLLTFVMGDGGDDGIVVKLGRSAPVESQAGKPLRVAPLDLSIQAPTGWTVYEDVNGARIHAVAPVSGDTYAPNLRLVSSAIDGATDTAAYWQENRAAVLGTLPDCAIESEKAITVGDVEAVEATITYTGADALPLTMQVRLLVHGGQGISITGIAPTADAATWRDDFSQAMASLRFD